MVIYLLYGHPHYFLINSLPSKEGIMLMNEEQVANLKELKSGNYPHYMKVKAMVLLALVKGHRKKDITEMFDISRQSIYNWLESFQKGGIASLRVREGRGRKSRVDPVQIEEYLRQSPRNFGIPRTRWTLAYLAKAVPCLKGYSPYGVQKVLNRLGYGYKRGQPQMHSPDPDYFKKNGVWRKS